MNTTHPSSAPWAYDTFPHQGRLGTRSPSPYLPTANIIETHHITRRTPGQNLGVLLYLFFCILVIKAVCFHLIKIAGQNPRALQR